ncbi:MAG: hypothetical protein ABEJ72_09335, partial [Candidatus Aenigmatarchaeota archaeon]
GDRKKELPHNPVVFLFKLTTGLTSSMGRVRDEMSLEVPHGMRYQFERVIVPIYRSLRKREGTEEYERFQNEVNDVFSLLRTKFRKDRFDLSFVERFVETALQEETDRKFGRFLEKLRGE